MPRKEDIDAATRRRLIAHLRRRMAQMGLSKADAARLIEVHHSVLSKVLSGDRDSLGFDVALKINRRLNVEADVLLNVDPDPKWFEQGAEVRYFVPQDGPRSPSEASRPAQSERRKSGGRT